MKVIIYIRNISENLSELEFMKTECKRLCEERNLELVKIIEQEEEDENENIINIIKSSPKEGCLVTYSVATFGSRQLYIHRTIEVLEKRKYRLLTVFENIDSSKDLSLLIGLIAWANEVDNYQGYGVAKAFSNKGLTNPN